MNTNDTTMVESAHITCDSCDFEADGGSAMATGFIMSIHEDQNPGHETSWTQGEPPQSDSEQPSTD